MDPFWEAAKGSAAAAPLTKASLQALSKDDVSFYAEGGYSLVGPYVDGLVYAAEMSQLYFNLKSALSSQHPLPPQRVHSRPATALMRTCSLAAAVARQLLRAQVRRFGAASHTSLHAPLPDLPSLVSTTFLAGTTAATLPQQQQWATDLGPQQGTAARQAAVLLHQAVWLQVPQSPGPLWGLTSIINSSSTAAAAAALPMRHCCVPPPQQHQGGRNNSLIHRR